MNSQSWRRWLGLLMREVRENKVQVIVMPHFFSAIVLLLLLLVTSDESVSTQELIDQLMAGLNTIDITAFAPAFSLFGAPYLFIMMVSAAVYLSKSLWQDRRDQSYLFWQSMPVSDTQTVLSKLLVALFVMPVTYALALLLLALILLVGLCGSALVLGVQLSGVAGLISVALTAILYTFLSSLVSMLWLFPACAWLLLFSAFATRTPLLWAAGAAFVLALLERALVQSDLLATWMSSRSNPWQYLVFDLSSVADRLLSYDMLFGFLLGAVLLYGAVQLRRQEHYRLLIAVVTAAVALVAVEGLLSDRQMDAAGLSNPFFDFRLAPDSVPAE